ncbi:MAG: hypothetical protein N2111_14130 [Candidatus Sumerlaeaceae bacterium]|nr:hypothetical protein [Candidatus Sumerlaeaceae bacterium]
MLERASARSTAKAGALLLILATALIAGCTGVSTSRLSVPPGAQTISVAPPDMVADSEDP